MTVSPKADRQTTIGRPQTPDDIGATAALFKEYAVWLDDGRCLGGFDAEMAAFPQGYAVLLLAKINGEPAGAVGAQAVDTETCEMKRLYVPEAFRGHGLGRALCDRLMAEASALGFKRMRLETLSRLTEAIALYRSQGFVECGERDGVITFEKPLV